MVTLDEAFWAGYEREGWARLGRLLDDDALAALTERIDQVMLGQADLDYERLMMQVDTTSGAYRDLDEQTAGFKGPRLDYRKIEGLEAEPRFRALVQHPVAAEVCRRVYGAGTAVAAYRCMFMNKPASAGTRLPWHQDRWFELDRDPLVTFYVALDPATSESGCVHIVPRSHRELLNPDHPSAFLDQHHVTDQGLADREIPLEMEPGEAVLLHNWLVHRSGVNRSGAPRRAFSACYMEAATVDLFGQSYPVVFDEAGGPAPPDRRTPVTAG